MVQDLAEKRLEKVKEDAKKLSSKHLEQFSAIITKKFKELNNLNKY